MKILYKKKTQIRIRNLNTNDDTIRNKNHLVDFELLDCSVIVDELLLLIMFLITSSLSAFKAVEICIFDSELISRVCKP